MSFRRLITWLLMVAGVALVALVVFVATFDANRHREEIQRRVSLALGRDIVVQGRLEVGLGLRPSIIAEQVVIANPGWASREHFARAERIELEIDLLAMLGDEIKLRGARVIGADILFERHADGSVNWSFRLGGVGGDSVVDLGLTRFEELTLAFLSDESEWSTEVDTGELALPADGSTSLSVTGMLENIAYQGSASRLSPSTPWSLDLKWTTEAARSHWIGEAEQLIPPNGVQGEATLWLRSFGDFIAPDGIEGTGPLSMTGSATFTNGQYRLTIADGQIETASGRHVLEVTGGRVESLGTQWIQASLSGQMQGVPVALGARLELGDTKALPVVINVRFGEDLVAVDGDLVPGDSGAEFAGRARVQLGGSHSLARALQLDLESWPALAISTPLQWRSRILTLPGVEAQFGAGMWTGSVQLNLAGGRPKLSGAVRTPLIALRARLGEFSLALKEDIELGWTDSIDADLTLGIDRVEASPSVRDVSFTLGISPGRVSLSEIEASVAGGRLTGRLGLDRTGTEVAMSADAVVRQWAADTGNGFGVAAAEVKMEGVSTGVTAAALLDRFAGRLAAADVRLLTPDAVIQMDTVRAEVGPGAPLTLQAHGALGEDAFQLSLTGGLWSDLVQSREAWPHLTVDFAVSRWPGLRLGGTVGPFENLLRWRDIDLDLKLEGDGLAIQAAGHVDDPRSWPGSRLAGALEIGSGRLDQWLDLSRQDLPPLSASADLVLGSQGLQAEAISARWGHLEVAGQGSYVWSDRRSLSAELNAPLLDLDRTGLLGSNLDARVSVSGDTLIPLIPGDVDLDLALKFGRVNLYGQNLRAGQLRVRKDVQGTSITTQLADRALRGSFKLGSTQPREAELSLLAAGFSLGGGQEGSGVPIDAYIRISGQGATFGELRRSTDGIFAVHFHDGSFVRAPRLLFGGNVMFELLKSANPFTSHPATGSDSISIECASAVLVVHDGVATADSSIAIEAPSTNLIGSGQIDLSNDDLSLSFIAEGRKGIGFTLGGVVTQFLRVGGTLEEPKLEIDKQGSLKSGALAIATGGLSILATDVFHRATSLRDPCLAVIEEHQAIKPLIGDGLSFHDLVIKEAAEPAH